MDDSLLRDKVEKLQNICIDRATGGSDDVEYEMIREQLQREQRVSRILPSFVRTNRTSSQFWQFIKYKFPTYAERRSYIWGEFNPLFEILERGENAPNDEVVSGILPQLDSDYVHQTWKKALDRRTSDLDGAITVARTLLESVCKNILDDLQVTYESDCDLPRLYKKTAEELSLAPSQHTEDIFKRILGGGTSVVEGLGALRNRISDAHGQGRYNYRPSARHAELAVNLAGSMAMFLVSTWVAFKEKAK